MDFILAANTRIRRFYQKHSYLVVLVFGCLIISAWTLIRFFTSGPNFDQIGQQVLAHQWLHGVHSGSVIGPTNYVLKMLFLYMPLDFVSLPAQLKLVLMTIFVNLLTFVLLAFVLKRLWLEFFPGVKNSFYLPLIYLSLIGGSVYWISFTNSRNLEVVGGVYLIYLYIRAQAHPSRLYYGLIVLLGSLLFFADPLQIYMSLLPAALFMGLRWFTKKDREQLATLVKILGCGVISIFIAHLLTRLVASTWHISFIETGRVLNFSASSIKQAAEQMARLYAGGFEGGRVREAFDLLVVAGGVASAAYYAWRQPKSRRILSLVAIVWVCNLVVYMVSGQAQQTGTNRYLIMTVPAFILGLAAVLQYLPRKKIVTYTLATLILFNTVSLGAAFAHAWNPHFTNNNHERSAISYFKSHHYNYGYASIGTALSSDYLSNWKVNVLPLGCDPGQVLKKTNLFFDKGAFNIAKQYSANTIVPIVLDGNTIKINQDACGLPQIEQQLGHEQSLDHLSDGSVVLLYQAADFNNLR